MTTSNRAVLCLVSVCMFATTVTSGVLGAEKSRPTTNAFWVATGGNDAGAGTESSPFATLWRARDALRELKKAGGLPEGAVTIRIRGGIYPFDRTLHLTAEDSGTSEAPIVFRASPGEKVLFDGSGRLDAKALELVEGRE